MNKFKAYLDDVVKEMRKVSWPTRQEVMSNTGLTILATLVISLFIFGADQVISAVLEFIYS